MAKAKFNDSTNSNRNGPGGPGGPDDPKKDDAFNKLTEAIVGLTKRIDSLDKYVSENNKRNKTVDRNNKEQKAAEQQKANDAKILSILSGLKSTRRELDSLKGLSFSQRGTRGYLKDKAEDLKSRALKGEDVTEEYRRMRLELYQLEDANYKRNHGAFSSLKNAAANSPKTKGMLSMGLGLVTGINPVLLQALGLDKAAKWAGGKALDGISSLFKKRKSNKAEADSEDGTPNGTGGLSDKKTGFFKSIDNGVGSILNLVKRKSKKDDEDKKEDKGVSFPSILSMVLASLAFAFSGNITNAIGGALGGGDFAKGLGKTFSHALPGAILGFSMAGTKGILPGALLSLLGYYVFDKVDTIRRMLSGEPPREVGPLSGDILEGAIVGGALGFKAAKIPGIIPGAVIGALSGLVFNAINSARAEEEGMKQREQDSLKQIEDAKKSGKALDTTDKIQSIAQQLEAKEASGQKLNSTEKSIVEQARGTREEISDYEIARKKAEEEAMKTYGKSLSELTLDEKNDVMWDSDAGFEDYLYKLEKEGKITNDAATRALLKPIWDKNQGVMARSNAYAGNETGLWGGVKGMTGALMSSSWFSDNYTVSQEAVAKAIAGQYTLDTQPAPTTDQIYSDKSAQIANQNGNNISSAIKDKENKGGDNIVQNNITNNNAMYNSLTPR